MPGIFPENIDAVNVFSKCSTQWRVSNGFFIGLDYGAVISYMKITGIKNKNTVIEKVRILESEQLDIINGD